MNVAFLDRDGTLLWEPPESQQIDSLAKFRVLPGVFEGLSAGCQDATASAGTVTARVRLQLDISPCLFVKR